MSEQTGETEGGTSEEAKGSGFPIGCVALLLAPVVVLAVAVAGGGDDYDDDSPALQRMDAERYCKAEVEARLKSPATAEWAGVTTSGFGPFTIKGSVDAENSFGALMRNRFACTVTLVGDTWRLDNLDMGLIGHM